MLSILTKKREDEMIIPESAVRHPEGHVKERF